MRQKQFLCCITKSTSSGTAQLHHRLNVHSDWLAGWSLITAAPAVAVADKIQFHHHTVSTDGASCKP